MLRNSVASKGQSSASTVASQAQLSGHDLSAIQRNAESGDVGAQLDVAKAYAEGKGLPKNSAVAAAWFRKAAEQGNAEAQDSLGVMYSAGDGVERDKAEGLRWYRKAACQSYPHAMFHLGTAYYNGDVVEISDSSAYAWFLLAKLAGDQSAVEAISRAETDLKPDVILKGLIEIAKLYDDGQILPQSQAEATRWWLLAAQRGNLEAELTVASRYLSGTGVQQDFGQARHWCNEASKEDPSDKQSDPRAAYCLGLIYQRGWGVEKDFKAAREWYERSASAGHAPAAKKLALMHANGDGGKPDRVKASLILVGLARHDDKEALASLLELKKQMDKKEWEALRVQLQARHIDTSRIPDLFTTNPDPPLH
jgi:uncharacterized protein